jgi:FKBP-type peptidyl-prolyl cis-trans isomerase
MRKISLFTLAVILLAACQQNFKKGDKGLEYKIISSGNGPKIKVGQFMQLQIAQYINNGKSDSLLNDSRTNGAPIIEPFDSTSVPPEYFKILSQVKKNDSLVIRLIVDSMFAQNPGSMPPFIKKGYHFITTVKVVNIFNTREQADSANVAEMKIKQVKDSIESIKMLKQDDNTLLEFFKKNNIKATKTPLGAYVEIVQPGTGAIIDTSVVVKVNYTGRTLDGKMFDSNTDSSKGHVEPLVVNLTNDMSLGTSVIKGWTDGLKTINKGAKAKFYIPSPLAYGKQKMGDDLAANSILIFDIEVLDVLNKAQAKAEAEAKKMERKLKQQRYMDSIKKAMPDTSKRMK